MSIIGTRIAPMISTAALAQRRPEIKQASVPRAWGRVAGVVAGTGGTGILFEVNDRTIRFVDAANGVAKRRLHEIE